MSEQPESGKAPEPAHSAARRAPRGGDVLDNIYRLDAPLGKGGVGVVFRAWHLHLQRPCAIKFLHPQLVSNPELRTRFRREAQSAFQLGHPHIVAITDFRDDPSESLRRSDRARYVRGLLLFRGSTCLRSLIRTIAASHPFHGNRTASPPPVFCKWEFCSRLPETFRNSRHKSPTIGLPETKRV